jgi:outer membrane protein W
MKKLVLSFAAVAMLASAAVAGKSNLFANDENSTFSSSLNMKKKKGGDGFGEGAMVLTVGYGFPNLGKAILKTYETEAGYKASGFGPAHIKFEYGLTDKFGMGVSIGYVGYKVSWQSEVEEYNSTTGNYDLKTYEEGLKGTNFGVLLRMNFHFATSDKVDPYWGIGAGYNKYTFKFYSDDPNSIDESLTFPIPVGFESSVGARFYFTENIGAYAELGWGKSLIQAGLAAKF